MGWLVPNAPASLFGADSQEVAMTIQMRGNVTVSTLHDTTNAAMNTPHRGALATIYSIIARNCWLYHNGATITTEFTGAGRTGEDRYAGFFAAYDMEVRSCHGDANLSVTVDGSAYESVMPITDALFQTNTVKQAWWDYARNSTTAHVPNADVNMAAFVEFNCTTFLDPNNRYPNLQTQICWLAAPALPVAKIGMGAGVGALPAVDGPRILYCIIGDFFIYTPNHYQDGYIVTDDNDDLLQTKHFY